MLHGFSCLCQRMKGLSLTREPGALLFTGIFYSSKRAYVVFYFFLSLISFQREGVGYRFSKYIFTVY